MTKTMEQVQIAQSYAGEKKLALALVHLNAAAVFAAVEMPQHIPEIRNTIDYYRNAHIAMRRHQELGL